MYGTETVTILNVNIILITCFFSCMTFFIHSLLFLSAIAIQGMCPLTFLACRDSFQPGQLLGHTIFRPKANILSIKHDDLSNY